MVHTVDPSTIIKILSSSAQVLMVMVMIVRDKEVQVSVRRSQSQWCIPVIRSLSLNADRKLRSFKWQSRVFRLLKVSKFRMAIQGISIVKSIRINDRDQDQH